MGFGLGDGKRIRFWEDVWCFGRSLALLYLVIFQLAFKLWLRNLLGILGYSTCFLLRDS